MFHTAVPFGYLLTALFLAVVFVAGAGTFVVGLRLRFVAVRWLGVGLCASVFLAIGSGLYDESSLEWNPSVSGDSQIVGTWTDYARTMTLASDHTFVYRNFAHTMRGTWTRDDFNLFLHGEASPGTMRFVQLRGTNRLMTHPPSDPDEWDGDLGLWLTRR